MQLHSILRSLGTLLLFAPSATIAAAQCGQWDPRIGVPGIAGSGNPVVYCSTMHDDGTGEKLYVGGGFTLAGGVTVNNVACWDGTSWSTLGSGTDQLVLTMISYDDGQGAKLYIGGNFTMAGGQSANRIACWDGSSWSAVGGGTNGPVNALAVGRAGSGGTPFLYAAGSFSNAGSLTQVNNIASWDGSVWQKLGTGVVGCVSALALWDQDGGGPGTMGLYASGNFNTAGGNAAAKIARWDGTTWGPLGQGLSNGALTLAAFDDGSGEKLYAGGQFNQAGGAPISFIASWNGSSWAGVGADALNGAVIALAVHDDGSGPSLYAGGQFTFIGSQQLSRIGRWNGTSWQSLGPGIGQGEVRTLRSLQDAGSPALLAGGVWQFVDSLPSLRVALWRGESVGVNYCIAKVTSGGCVPTMSASGMPSMSAPGSFLITAASLRPNSNGLIFFTLAGPQDVPFQDGHLCVKSPFYRLQVKNSGGSGACAGALTYTLAEVLAHPGGGPLIVVGSRLDFQAWFRDPPAMSATGLSDGLDLYVCP